jgi:CheY-like chemotaxis protein
LAPIVLFGQQFHWFEGVEEMGKRVLVVEDDRHVRDYLAAALESSGHEIEIVAVANGREAAEQLVALQIDLVLTDLNMPEVNGVELVRSMRALHPAIPVVLMSGASADWMPELMQEGFDELPMLTKPVSVSQLIELVTGILGV